MNDVPPDKDAMSNQHSGEDVEDLCPQKMAEADAAKLFMSAFDVAGELVVLRRSSGHIIHVNKAFLTAFGGDMSDWKGRWFSVAPPRSVEDYRRYDMLMRTREGPAWIEWDERLLPDDGGVISVGRDVTSRREAHENLAASQRAKALFFAAVTHELRTPLAGALGISHLLEATPLRPDQADYVRTLSTSTEHALAMIDDILDLSRLEAGKLRLRPQSVDMAQLVREVIELTAPKAQEKGLEINLVYKMSAPSRVEGDAARLKQILFNLIGNAVKFTQTGGVRVEISNNPDAEGKSRLFLSVKDTGPGVSEADQETLFENFERGAAEREGHESGAGLGLAMVRRLVEAMDSSMGVQSKLGEGSEFWVTFELPVLENWNDEPLSGRELAVASENETLREALAEQLRTLGGDVVAIDRPERIVAASGRELLLDQSWAENAPQAHASHIWLLVAPDEKDVVIENKPEAVDGWMVKPVRWTTLIEQITGIERESVDKPNQDETAGPVLDGLRVMVAEDDPVNALIARKTLERKGAIVTVVDTGSMAIQTLESGAFEAALLDQRMPGMDGKNVAELARLAGVEIPLIALTANSSEEDRKNCLEAGMDAFLTKPVDPDLLAETLLRLCATKKQASIG